MYMRRHRVNQRFIQLQKAIEYKTNEQSKKYSN